MTQRRIAKRLCVAVSAGLTLAGCAASVPVSPTVMALPPPGEDFAVFQQHEQTCRHYASAQTGGETPGQAASKSGLGGAVVGTGLGAAAGALLGSASGHVGSGAAIGAGSGLLVGGLLGSARGKEAAAAVQHQYDMSYEQCMVANGERIAAPVRPVVYAPPPVIYAPPPVYVPAPVYALPPGGVVRVPG